MSLYNMAVLFELDLEVYNDWVASRPPTVKAVAEKYFPNRLYRLKSSGHRVTLYSISEDGTITVNVTGQYNCVVFERRVFGVKPEDLEECELPCEGELVGTLLTEDAEIEAFIQAHADSPGVRGCDCDICSRMPKVH